MYKSFHLLLLLYIRWFHNRFLRRRDLALELPLEQRVPVATFARIADVGHWFRDVLVPVVRDDRRVRGAHGVLP